MPSHLTPLCDIKSNMESFKKLTLKDSLPNTAVNTTKNKFFQTYCPANNLDSKYEASFFLHILNHFLQYFKPGLKISF